jgi:uncharacterized protein (TIGR00730 family)
MKNNPNSKRQESIDYILSRIPKDIFAPEAAGLLSEIISTIIKLGMEAPDKGDLKLVNNALKELRYSFKIFSPYRDIKKVAIFGSARTSPSACEYKMAVEFAKRITDKGYMVVTGGGPGIMEAGNKGSGKGKDFALNIRLPFEQKPNPYINEQEKLINFKYFFTRKLIFIKETDATVLFPGGFGTHDEGFEILTLMQTGKARPRPIVLIESGHSTYWETFHDFIEKELSGNAFISKDDLNLFYIAKTVEDAIKYIDDFYSIYHSIRYAGDITVLRLNKPLPNKALTALNKKFKSIMTKGRITCSGPLRHEKENNEYPNLPRLIMYFNRRDYGQLLQMIHFINKAGDK